jgi:hypothetical protein
LLTAGDSLLARAATTNRSGRATKLRAGDDDLDDIGRTDNTPGGGTSDAAGGSHDVDEYARGKWMSERAAKVR